jgi:hypothetical protein
MDHSWFITFDKDHTCGIIPTWFFKWWNKFGLIPDVLPLSLVESYETARLMPMVLNFLICFILLNNIVFPRLLDGNMLLLVTTWKDISM